VDRLVAVLHDARQGRLVATALSGPSPELASRLRTLEEAAGSGGSLLSDVFQSGKTARLTGETRVRRLSPLLSALGTREQLVVPLVAGGRPFGLLVADSPISGRPFEEDAVGPLEIVARLLAVSLAGERNAGAGPDV
jgi:GAF domain-containing protein